MFDSSNDAELQNISDILLFILSSNWISAIKISKKTSILISSYKIYQVINKTTSK